MKELVEILPDIILYIALGYSFVQSYKYVRIIRKTKTLDNLLIESLVVGFVLHNTLNSIIDLENIYFDTVGKIILSVVLGYIVGVFINSNVFRIICKVLKIRQTPNTSIWKDIEDRGKGVIVRVENYDKKIIIDGIYILAEAHKRFPIIQLAGYRKYENGEIVRDYEKEPQNTILVDTSKFDEINVLYDEKSNKTKHLK